MTKQARQTKEERKEKKSIYQKKWYTEKGHTVREANRLRYKHAVRDVYNLLGSKCNRCGFDDMRALQIDHIKGGGHKERMKRSNAYTFYRDIATEIKNGKVKFQILCANCNWIEAIEKGFRKSIWQ